MFLTGGPRISPETLEHTQTRTYAPSHTQDGHVNTHPVFTRKLSNQNQRVKINPGHSEAFPMALSLREDVFIETEPPNVSSGYVCVLERDTVSVQTNLFVPETIHVCTNA